MKVLHVIDSLGGGGAEKLIDDLLPVLCKDHNCECEVLVITLNNDKYSQDLNEAGVRVTEIPRRSHIGRIRFIKSYVIEGGFDLVHAHLFPVTYYCALARRMGRCPMPPLVMTEHSTDNKRRHIPILRPLERFIYSTYDSIIAISAGTKDALVRWLGSDACITVVHNGILLDSFYQASSIDRIQLVPACKKDDILLCMVGSLSMPKNHLFMLAVLHELPERYHLVCLGEGPLEDEISQRALELSVEERLHLLGFRRDVASCMKTCDMAVIPSLWEGFGLVAAEEMACGLPVVASNVPGLTEIIEGAGITCATSSATDFAKAVLLATRKAADLGANSLRRSGAFDIYVTAEGYMDVYSRVLWRGAGQRETANGNALRHQGLPLRDQTPKNQSMRT